MTGCWMQDMGINLVKVLQLQGDDNSGLVEAI